MTSPVPFVRFTEIIGVTLTMPQRVLAGVAFDGANPCDYAGEEREVARRLFGSLDRVDDPVARGTVCLVMGRGASKSYLGALWLLWRALTGDAIRAKLAKGQVGYCVVVAPRLKLGREVINYATGASLAEPRIQVVGQNVDTLTILRPDGVKVAIECLPASSHGVALRGRTFFAAMLDETAFLRGEDAAISDIDLLRSIRPRLKGAPVLIASTPWAKEGLLWETYRKNFGKATDAIVATAPTAVMRPDDVETLAMVEQERRRDPENARRELDAEFLDGETAAFFDPETIDRAIALPAPSWGDRPPAGAVLTAGGDAGFVHDSSALVTVARVGERYDVLDVLEMRPGPSEPLKPSAVVHEWATLMRTRGVLGAVADRHYREAIREYLTEERMTFIDAPADVSEPYVRARTLLREGRVRLPDNGRLRRQLRDVVSRPRAGGGMAISSPRGPSGHGDIVSALVLALWQAFGSRVQADRAAETEDDRIERTLIDRMNRRERDAARLFGGK